MEKQMTKENNELIKLDNKNSHKNLSGYLEDHYNLVDSSYENDLVPSMIYRYNAMNEDDFIWIGFPNSNNLNEDNEEWNNFKLF